MDNRRSSLARSGSTVSSGGGTGGGTAAAGFGALLGASNARRSPGVVRYAVTPTWEGTIPHKVMQARGWEEVDVDDGTWDFIYADVVWIHEHIHITYSETLRLAEWQRVNHFPNHVELTRKDLMAKHLKRAVRAAQKAGRPAEVEALAFFPATFVLPAEGALLLDAFRAEGGVWIFKPVGRAQGRGIFIVSRVAQVEAWLRERAAADRALAAAAAAAAAGGAAAASALDPDEAPEAFVVQRYLERPLLAGGRKFDLRLYCLVTCFAPLRCWLYREGFARFTARRYASDAASLSNPFVHLTNHAVQKKDAAYDAAQCDLKWPLSSLRAYLQARYGDAAAAAALGAINAVVLHTLRAVAPSMINDRHCAEMYGYDIMLDDSLKPWLIEVNASPSLSADTAADAALKMRLVDDYLSVLDVEGAWGAAGPPSPCGGFDLIWESDAPVQCADFPGVPSMLGAANDRAAPQLGRVKAAAAAAMARMARRAGGER